MSIDRSDSSPRVLWFFGADAAGKSVVGWEAYRLLTAAGVPAAYIDLDYLGFCEPRPDDFPGLVADNLEGVWRGFRSRGIRCLVVSGIVVNAEERQRYGERFPGCELHLVLLRAQPGTIKDRIVLRREVEALQQGTTLDETVLRELGEYADRSIRFGAFLEAGGFADVVLDTDGLSPTDIAGRALERLTGH